MREIGRNESASDAQLTQAMRRMAGESPCGAPPEMAELLAGKFRQHHARRKAKRRIVAAGMVACLALGLTILMKQSASPPAMGAHVEATQPAAPEPLQAAANMKSEAGVAHKSGHKFVRPHARAERAGRITAAAGQIEATNVASANVVSANQEFLALPAYNPTVRLEDTNVVRVEMPGSTLRLVGAPVSAESGQRRVLADFVVGRDGTPYAVRLIAVRNTQ